MIRSFKNLLTEKLYTTGKTRGLPAEIIKRAVKRLQQLDSVTELDDLRCPPSNHLKALDGNRSGQHSVRINDQWRLCFVWGGSDAFDVEIVDYHQK
jgi:proteic killer suppression protein